MPFNPNVPQPGQKLDADVVRAQLNALNDKIDALPPVGAPETDPEFVAWRTMMDPNDDVFNKFGQVFSPVPSGLNFFNVNDLTAGGYIKFTGLPTTNPGDAGRLWNDGGTLKVSAG